MTDEQEVPEQHPSTSSSGSEQPGQERTPYRDVIAERLAARDAHRREETQAWERERASQKAQEPVEQKEEPVESPKAPPDEMFPTDFLASSEIDSTVETPETAEPAVTEPEQPNVSAAPQAQAEQPARRERTPRGGQQRERNDRPERGPRDRRPKREGQEERTETREERRPQREAREPREERPDRRGTPQRDRLLEGGNVAISVIIPLLNEQDSIRELCGELNNVLHRMVGSRFEVILIDDGSTDRSFEIIRDFNRINNRFKGIRFRRNYGKAAALAQGFALAQGNVVVTMDADLQDDPKEIPNLINKLREGYDLVSGWKKKRYDPITKTIPSRFFNFVTSVLSGVKLHDFNCGLKAYRRDVIKEVTVYGELHRFIPVLAHWRGFRVTETIVEHHRRRHGKTKFGSSRFWKGFLDLLTTLFTTRFIKRPLHFFGMLGAFLSIIGVGIDGYVTWEWSMGLTSISNRPVALLGVTLIIVGVQFISLGLLGEMVVKSRHHEEEYSVSETVK